MMILLIPKASKRQVSEESNKGKIMEFFLTYFFFFPFYVDRTTDDGYPLYDVKDLNIGNGLDTPECPFDCKCCKYTIKK